MNKNLIIVLTLFSLISFFIKPVHAQMMGSTQTTTSSAQDFQDIQIGQDIYDKFQNKQVTCNQLRDDDFEKLGEYVMNQSFGGNADAHIQVNNIMKQMMGENGEEQMHIRLGKNATGCNTNGQGGVRNMMNWGYGGMMGWTNGFSIFPFFIQLVVLIDLILAGVWLWKKISNKK